MFPLTEFFFYINYNLSWSNFTWHNAYLPLSLPNHPYIGPTLFTKNLPVSFSSLLILIYDWQFFFFQDYQFECRFGDILWSSVDSVVGAEFLITASSLAAVTCPGKGETLEFTLHLWCTCREGQASVRPVWWTDMLCMCYVWCSL